ncbi:hypothetical protein A9Q98_15855 [Thalassotalea sp. 42_200_T64]|nr:hypothetical protein A9Q98_15855 [Thalassotalea sp. 42_200_T64]
MDVSITWQGAGPRDIEEQIIIRFEEVLKSVEDIKSVVSKATEGRARITITGKERVDRKQFADAVREKINSVNGLPADADRARVSERVNRQAMIRLALHGDIPVRTLSSLAREIRKEIGALPLISNVNLLGVGQEEISIEISEQAMSLYKITFMK